MFIQVIEGKTSDPDALHERLEVWERDLMPGAVGYLGSTGGVTSSGDCILIARFESREAAQANSDRPEQGEWWSRTERCFDGPVTFHDSVEVQMMEHGELGSARFVQIMEGHVTDKTRAIELEHEADPVLAKARPELLGAITAFHGSDEFIEVAYFTSEDAARSGEQGDLPQEYADSFAEWQRVMSVDKYLDLPRPWLMTP